MRSQRLLFPLIALALGAALALAPQLSACGDGGTTKARAMRVTSRDQLVGGLRALGDLGDLVLSNGRIRAVVQGKSASRGFGVFGGSLIDLDLERPRPTADGLPVGADGLSEVFPAFFLRGLEPNDVEVASDGSDGGPAIVRVRGKGSEFLTGVTGINEMFLGSGFTFETEYQLDPVTDPKDPLQGRSIIVRTRASNAGTDPILVATNSFPVGFGVVVLMGGGQSLFLPGDAGYDVRFAMERAYKNAPPIPALPGIMSRALVSTGKGVSYAFAPERSPRNFVWRNRTYYPGATQDSLVVPFIASSFTGIFFHQPPEQLDPGQATTFATRIWVGTGDIASALDLALMAREEPLGNVTAVVREEHTGVPVADANVVLVDAQTRQPQTACRTLASGEAHARLPPGRYRAAVVAASRQTVWSEPFEVAQNRTTDLGLSAGQRAFVSATVVDADTGRPLPAKLSVVGRYGPENAGRPTQEFLFDLRIGEPYRYSDLIPDDPDRPETREFLEDVVLAGADGHAQAAIRPGLYSIVASRGPEYTLDAQAVDLSPGASRAVSFRLRRVVDTAGWIAGDFHVHSTQSIDSDLPLVERALSYAAEGIEYLALTDHNFVSDLRPAIEAARLSDWVRACPGLELSTLELGHFNAYPLLYDPGQVTRGSFEWFRIPAGDLFQKLREMGTLGVERTVVQVNHPRDTIMGYFNAFKVDETGRPARNDDAIHPQGPEFELGAWSEAFDAVEVVNSKRMDLIHTFRVPAVLPPPPLPDPVPAAGEILRDAEGRPAFPGQFEDWMAFLKRGRVLTGMANSDSHHVIDGEAGYPRTMIRTGPEPATMRDLDDGVVADAVKAQQAVMTTGPMVELFANGAGIGGLAAAPDGTVAFRVKVRAAPWVDVTRATLIGSDGTRVDLELLPPGGVDRVDASLERAVGGDAFFVVEVAGERSLWPVSTPLEIPPLALQDAVKSIGAAFGLGDDGYGNLRPNMVGTIKPYALTNPVWVDADRDGVSFGKGAKASPLVARPSGVRLPYRGVDVFKTVRQFDH